MSVPAETQCDAERPPRAPSCVGAAGQCGGVCKAAVIRWKGRSEGWKDGVGRCGSAFYVLLSGAVWRSFKFVSCSVPTAADAGPGGGGGRGRRMEGGGGILLAKSLLAGEAVPPLQQRWSPPPPSSLPPPPPVPGAARVRAVRVGAVPLQSGRRRQSGNLDFWIC